MRRTGCAFAIGIALIMCVGSAEGQEDNPAPEAVASEQPAQAAVHTTSEPTRKEYNLTGRLYLGADYRRVYDIPIIGGDAGLGLNWELRKPVAICLLIDLAIGTRGYGLGVRIGTLGVEVAYRLARLRFGAGAGAGFVSFDRVTEGVAFFSWDLVVWAMASYDVAQWGEERQQGMFIGARIESTIPILLAAAPFSAESSATAVWGPSAGVGVRF